MYDNVPLNELYWIAGFLEGEGTFVRCRNKLKNGLISRGGTITVVASQVQKNPLERLQKLLGGNIHYYIRNKEKGFFYYRWQIFGEKAEALMKILYPLMSPNRQNKMSLALAWYASRPGRNWMKSGRKICRKGLHPWIPENIVEVYGKRYCRICKTIRQEDNKRGEIKKSRISNLILN
jgi:hypothetical protein